ncbi:MAG: hypothetical protein ACYTFH_03170 [Planctomycetota bacterium]
MSSPLFRRAAWTAWALVPIAALAFHFGPGQAALRRDRAAEIVALAATAEREAIELQQRAYEAHLAAIEARAAAFANEDPERRGKAVAAGEREDAAATTAEAAWARTATLLEEAVAVLEPTAGEAARDDASRETAQRVRLARSRALVRSGEIGRGANELEDLLLDLGDAGEGTAPLAIAAREELAAAYYYGARLMRLGGKAGPEWRPIASLARQNFRYLAEHAASADGDPQRLADHQRNTELVLNLEQSSREELAFLPRPRQSPTGTGQGLGQELRPGRRGRNQGEQPARGAGMNGEIGVGW